MTPTFFKNLQQHTLGQYPIVYFEEGSVIIAHCVPLDVSSCGNDLEEARRNIRDAVAGFVETCEEIGTLEEVLEESGLVNQPMTKN